MTQYERIKVRRFLTKQKAVELKGGKCQHCGWNKNICSLEFHHRDPSKKESLISDLSKWEDVVKELEKCDLLCSNCHQIVHCTTSDPKFLELVKFYNGRDLECSNIPWKNGTNPLLIKPKRLIDPNWNLKKRKVIRPSKDELLELVKTISISKIREKFNLKSNTSIYKWCITYDIEYKKISPFVKTCTRVLSDADHNG